MELDKFPGLQKEKLAKRDEEKRQFYETLFMMSVLVATVFLFPKFLGIVSILPFLYFFIENRVRKHSNLLVIFKFKGLLQDLQSTWVAFLTVAFLLQAFYFYVFKNFSPELLSHVKERTSFIASFNIGLVLTLLVLALVEEVVFRGLFQKRINLKLSPLYSILITSIVFAALHISDGTPFVVMIDLATVFIDSVFYGYLFYKTNSVYVAWLAHALANITAAFLLIHFI
ncbi:CPBP family intramembrane glutamic endopeptidase [Lysinibacillus yapensis]|nr:type II CAAX endopeptidase family protein [Lysinibacillus yapensis]